MSLGPSATIDVPEEQIIFTKKEIHCVEGEIRQQLILSLSNLRAKENSYLPVFRLPPEVLAIIFVHGARDYYESPDGCRFSPCIPTWVNISYVCRRWRNIALDYPSLWAYHFYTSLPWTEELLLRSKQTLLKICIRTYYSHDEASLWPNLLYSLLRHSERIQELCLDVQLERFPVISLRAPHLKKLEIDFHCLNSFTIIDGDKLTLDTLELTNCSLPWYSLNLSRLKTLSLSFECSPSPLTVTEFLAILSNIQSITVLYLNYSLPSTRSFLSSGGLDTCPKINLPCLTQLTIILPLSTFTVLLSCVNIPPTTQLHLEPQFEPGSSFDDYAPLLSFLEKQFNQQSSGLIFRGVLLDAINWFHSLTFSPHCDAFSGGSMEMEYDVPLTIVLAMDGQLATHNLELERSMNDMTNRICHALPLTSVQSLHVIELDEFTSNIWEGILGCMSSLRRITLGFCDMPDLSLLSLQAVPGESDENPDRQPIPDRDLTSGHMFVPALEQLDLYEVLFAPEDVSVGRGVSQKSLFDTLSTRKGLRDRVIMTRCDVIRKRISDDEDSEGDSDEIGDLPWVDDDIEDLPDETDSE